MFYNVLASYILAIILNTSTFMSFCLFGTHTFVDKASAALDLYILTMNG